MKTTSRLTFLVLALTSLAAHAGHEPPPKPTPTPTPSSNSTSTSAAGAAAQSAAIGVGVGVGKGGDGGHANAQGGAGGKADAAATSSNAGNKLATSYVSDFDSLALALPGQTGAPAVAGECLEHTRGGSGLSIGVSGRTRINESCAARVQCLALADRYAAWGQTQLAVTQLASCGGVQNPQLLAPPVPQDPSPATREYIDRVFRSNARK